MEERRCKFWLPRKNRFCANAPLNDSPFCGNHKPRCDGQWILCPIDPSHSVLKENLDGHVRRCPLLKQTSTLSMQPFYQKGINAGKGEEDDITSEMKRNAVYSMSVAEFYKLVQKIESVHASICKDILESYKMTEACNMWIKREVDRKLPFQVKHVKQQASILGNLENFGVLKVSLGKEQCDEKRLYGDNIPAIVEFGAGRGYLTQMLADCYGIERVFLVERKSYKLKADRSLRQKESLILERLRIDIEDLDLNAVESLQGVPYLAIGKHLCGPATDKNFIADLGITKEEFHAITWFTSWAVDADHGSDLSLDCRLHLQVEEQCDEDAKGVEDVVRNMKAVERAVLGFMCKQIIDMGRMIWAKGRGLEAQLVKYVPSNVSPENHLLIAKLAKCL